MSSRQKGVYGFNVISGLQLYGRTLNFGQPYAIAVYDAETVRTYKGMSFLTFSEDKKSLYSNVNKSLIATTLVVY